MCDIGVWCALCRYVQFRVCGSLVPSPLHSSGWITSLLHEKTDVLNYVQLPQNVAMGHQSDLRYAIIAYLCTKDYYVNSPCMYL